MFLSPGYRSAAGCHRNGPIVAKWGMLMQSSILLAAVGPQCPSQSTVCTQHTQVLVGCRGLFNLTLSHVPCAPTPDISACPDFFLFHFCALK